MNYTFAIAITIMLVLNYENDKETKDKIFLQSKANFVNLA
jgi:Mg2+/citrate symporter